MGSGIPCLPARPPPWPSLSLSSLNNGGAVLQLWLSNMNMLRALVRLSCSMQASGPDITLPSCRFEVDPARKRWALPPHPLKGSGWALPS